MDINEVNKLTYEEFKNGMGKHTCPYCKRADCVACYKEFLKSEEEAK